jgi:hypothetical protein
MKGLLPKAAEMLEATHRTSDEYPALDSGLKSQANSPASRINMCRHPTTSDVLPRANSFLVQPHGLIDFLETSSVVKIHCMKKIRLLGVLLGATVCVVSFSGIADANEACFYALKQYDSASGASSSEERQNVVKVCQGSEQQQDPLLKQMLIHCEQSANGKMNSKDFEQCEIDALRFMSRGSYPGGPYHR